MKANEKFLWRSVPFNPPFSFSIKPFYESFKIPGLEPFEFIEPLG
jgi:hypothetical protein